MEISDAGSGVLFYLEEGRGVRLTSNLGAYTLQDMGFDTFDADERVFFTCRPHTANSRI